MRRRSALNTLAAHHRDKIAIGGRGVRRPHHRGHVLKKIGIIAGLLVAEMVANARQEPGHATEGLFARLVPSTR